MDPQQRQLLERGYAALHHVGAEQRSSLLGATVAVNVGQWASEFGKPCCCARPPAAVSTPRRAFRARSRAAASPLRSACTARAPLYDTACSASLVASYHGSTRALQRG